MTTTLPGAAEDAVIRTGEDGYPELICPVCGDQVENYDSDGTPLGTAVRAVLAHEAEFHAPPSGSLALINTPEEFATEADRVNSLRRERERRN